MRICYFGTYTSQEGYPMNEVLIRSLKENQVEVVECHQDLWKGRMDKVKSAKGAFSSFLFILRLFGAYISLAGKFLKTGPYDAIIVGYPGHFDFFIARLLNLFRGKKPVLINLLFPLYDTIVIDRQLVPPGSFRAKWIWNIDKVLLHWADRIILDTESHIKHLCKTFNVKRDKFIKVPVGADDTFFRPQTLPKLEEKRPGTHVLFFGTYIPLHGIETILRAAYHLKSQPDIHFTLIGSGQAYEAMQTLAKNLELTNVTFISSWVPYKDLARYIQSADICLGIFGTTEKAQRVIPCKIYNCLAVGKPVITADTPAAREIFSNGVHAILSPPGDADALARAILKLRDNPQWREDIGRAGYELFRTRLSPHHIGQDLKKRLEEIINGR